MDEEHVLAPDLVADLPQGFEKRLRLDIAHGPADLDENHLRAGGLRHQAHAAFDLVGDVRDNLNRPAEVINP